MLNITLFMVEMWASGSPNKGFKWFMEGVNAGDAKYLFKAGKGLYEGYGTYEDKN